MEYTAPEESKSATQVCFVESQKLKIKSQKQERRHGKNIGSKYWLRCKSRHLSIAKSAIFRCVRCPAARPPRETIEAIAIEAKAIPKSKNPAISNIPLRPPPRRSSAARNHRSKSNPKIQKSRNQQYSFASAAPPPVRREKPSKQKQSQNLKIPQSAIFRCPAARPPRETIEAKAIPKSQNREISNLSIIHFIKLASCQ